MIPVGTFHIKYCKQFIDIFTRHLECKVLILSLQTCPPKFQPFQVRAEITGNDLMSILLNFNLLLLGFWLICIMVHQYSWGVIRTLNMCQSTPGRAGRHWVFSTVPDVAVSLVVPGTKLGGSNGSQLQNSKGTQIVGTEMEHEIAKCHWKVLPKYLEMAKGGHSDSWAHFRSCFWLALSMGRHLASTNSSAVKFCMNHSGKPSMARLAHGNYSSMFANKEERKRHKDFSVKIF